MKCSAFWNHTNIRSGNRVYPCCRFKRSIDTFDGDVDNVLHSDAYKDLREQSAKGEFIKGCEKCFYEEKIGHKSLREEFNEKYTMDKVDLKFLEIGFDQLNLNYEEYVVSSDKYYRPNEVNHLLGDYSKAKNEEESKEPEEKKSTSENTTTSVVSSKKNIKQKKVQSKKTINAKLEKVMTKIDKEIKNSSKNLQLKNLIKMDVMIGEQLSLAVYENVEFYKPKVIYLNQLDIQDDRKIYSDITLAKYTDKDIIGIKQKELQLLDDKKQQLLIELEVLKNG